MKISPSLPLLDAREVKSHADFLAIASRYMKLRRAGRQSVGLCPFHSERHPSCYVHHEKKIFYCFGCGRGGDVFDFVMLAESCDFLEALRIVAKYSGVASESEPRSGERIRASVGASPGLAKQGISYSSESRAKILAALDATNRRLHAIEVANHWPSVEDCAAERAFFTSHKPDNSP
jgi:DNA primase